MKSFVVYDFMIKDLKLKGYELLIYSIIFSFTTLGQRCFISIKKYSQLLGCSIKQVRRCLSKLNEKRLVLYTDGYYITNDSHNSSCMMDQKEALFDLSSINHEEEFYDWESIFAE